MCVLPDFRAVEGGPITGQAGVQGSLPHERGCTRFPKRVRPPTDGMSSARYRSMSASEPHLDSQLGYGSSPSGIRRAAGQERRADVRVAIEVEVSLSSESHFFVGLSGDVSRGGLFVVTWRKLPVGTPIFVAVDLPEGRLLADAEVRWVRDAADGVSPGLGIAFTSISEEDQRRIDTFCAQRAPLYFDVEE